jgi:hypothetical protein
MVSGPANNHRCRITLVALLVFLSIPLDAAKKKPVVNWVRRPAQSVRLAQMPLVVAKQKCENWAWAASLEAMLRLQDAPIPQEYWIQRLNHGEVCLPRAESFENLARFLESDSYVLDNGHKLRLQVQYHDGAPTSPDDLIASVQRNQPIMLFWNGHPYLIAGVLYDELIAPNGGRRFEVRELKLLDPYVNPKPAAAASSGRTIFESRREEPEVNAECAWAPTPQPAAAGAAAPATAQPSETAGGTAEKPPCVPDDPRIVGFVKGRDNLAEIDGTFQVRVVWQ